MAVNQRIARRQASPPLSVATERYDQEAEERFRAELTRFVQDSVQGVDLPEVVTPAALAAGFTNDFDPGVKLRSGNLIIRFEPNAATSNITGFVGGTDGMFLRVTPYTGGSLLLIHQNVGSAAKNRIISPTALNITLPIDAWADLVYDETSLRWRITNHTGTLFITDSDISSTAEIAVSKLADGTARQLLQTDAVGTGVEWTSDIDLPGTARAIAFLEDNILTLGNNATPSVLNRQVMRTGGTTTITDFDDGFQGQRLTILAQHTVTITHNASIIVLAGSVNFGMVSGDTLVLQSFNNQVWHEISRNVI